MSAAEKLTPAHQQPRIISIASGKGGVGKTWFASTLAAAMGARGHQTLLVDGDLGLANIDVQLGIAPESDLVDVISGESSLETSVCPMIGGVKKGGFDVVSGRSGSGALSALTTDEITNLCSGIISISLKYDTTIVDIAAGLERPTLRLASLADDTLVVVTDEPTSLTDAYAFIKMVRLAKPLAEPRIVVNMANSQSAGMRTYEAISKSCLTFLNYAPPLAGIIHRDKCVPDSIRKQKPIAQAFPQSPAWGQVKQLANAINQAV